VGLSTTNDQEGENMSRERETNRLELEQLAAGLGEVFIRRWDLYAHQREDGSYICIRKPLKQKFLLDHLKGDITLGAYVLGQDSTAHYVAFDADDEEEWEQLANMRDSLAQEGVPSYLENSRRGGHLWMFFPWMVSGKEAQDFGRGLSKIYDLEGIEFFPKQEQLQDGPGSLIRLPFGIHRKSGKRYGFVDAKGDPLSPSLGEQVQILSAPQCVPEGMFEGYRMIGRSKPKLPELQPLDETETTLSEQIKARVSVYDFISQYVELSSSGRGLCPFHDDHHASFSVNQEKNYWNCFAGCGGGSIIDFWMEWKDCDFPTAVKELAQQLL
jgi:hypothetical protein